MNPLANIPKDIMDRIIDRASKHVGDGDDIGAALGFLCMAQLYGWRGVYMAYGRNRIKFLEGVLGICVRDYAPERTALTSRILGVRLADELGRFWAVLKGDVRMQYGRRSAVSDYGQGNLFEGPQ